jgi:Tfp pilus assembly protein PilF
MEDVFAIQDEISRGIVSRLKVRLLGAGVEALVKPATADFEAYTLYLKGRQLWNRRTEESLRQGLQAFEAALARDPGYALAWAGVADSYVILGFYSALPPREAFPRAKAAALRALELDPALADAHPALAYVRMYHDWDWAAAEQAFRTAIELNPSHATAHQWYGNFLAIIGRFDESEREFTRAVALDPLSPLRSAALGWGYYFARRYQDAAAQCRLALELDSESVVSHHWLGLVLEQMGQPAAAVAELREAVRLSGRAVAPLGSLGHTLAIGGAGEEAQTILAELNGRAREHYVPSYDVALIHLGLGDRPAALDALSRACEERSHQMAFIKVDPRLDPLRGEARFVGLLEEVGLG